MFLKEGLNNIPPMKTTIGWSSRFQPYQESCDNKKES